MKKATIFSVLSVVGILAVATMGVAGEVVWTELTHSSLVGVGPGLDGLMATSDDVADARNASGSITVATIEWGTPGPTCPAQSGPDEVSYGVGVYKWCMGDPTSGQFKFTSINETYTSIPQIGSSYTTMLTPGGGPNTGTPCGFNTSGTQFSATIDWQLMVGMLPVSSVDDLPVAGTIYLVSDNNPAPVTCNKVDGGTSTYTTQDLLTIRALLPAQATAYAVSCNAVQGPANPDPCWDQAWSGSANITWTSHDVSSSACDGCAAPPPGSCAGSAAE